MRAIVLLLLVLCAALPAAADKPKLALLPLAPLNLAPDTVRILDSILVVEAERLGTYEVIAASEINALLGMERMKQAVGCDDIACAAEIGGALDARYMVTGSAGRLGDDLNLNLVLYDVPASRVERRARQVVRNDENLYAGALLAALAQLFPSSSASPSAATGGASALAQAQQQLALDERLAREAERLVSQIELVANNPALPRERQLELIDGLLASLASDSPLRRRALGLRDQVAVGEEGLGTLWVQAAFTLSPGLQVEVARWRWPRVQFAAFTGVVGWLWPGGAKGSDGMTFGAGLAGLGIKTHFELAGTNLELGLMGWPLYFQSYDVSNVEWMGYYGGFSGLGFLALRPYAALNLGGVQAIAGLQLLALWYKFDDDYDGNPVGGGGWYAGLPPLSAFVGIGY